MTIDRAALMMSDWSGNNQTQHPIKYKKIFGTIALAVMQPDVKGPARPVGEFLI